MSIEYRVSSFEEYRGGRREASKLKTQNSKLVRKKDIGSVLHQWSKDYTIFVPCNEGDTAFTVHGSRLTVYGLWDGSDINLDWYRNTVTPPKANFLPPLEEMFRFQKGKEGHSMELPFEPGVWSLESGVPLPQLIFGIRPCDARALSLLDLIFTDAYQDPYYLPRREGAVLVGLVCLNPYDSCFCTSLGIGPGESDDVDLLLTDIGDEFLIEEISDKGKRLMELTAGLKDATEDDTARANEAKEKAYGRVTRKINTEGIKDRLLSAFEDEHYWEKVAAKCIACGICTFLCPTCYCFDISDEMVKKQGARFRCWDSCAFALYTKMPMENPREEKWQRVRQKVCHKFEFYPMTFDVIACTGCGRCIRLCPVNWDITQTLRLLD
ncbi:MAG: 4Fe-4S dicluster domain-containing protein [Dehalococcoidia bacterium]|nr:Anaerobic sulfite reductase subunit A [Chloroflexota bacterium]MBT9161688.1 Anaerobic sulfite reductase subunit A [Chloroflexota bacterium]